MVSPQTILVVKYIAMFGVLALIMMAPAYLAAKTDKGKVDTMRIRLATWAFGWTIIGWFLALFWAIKK